MVKWWDWEPAALGLGTLKSVDFRRDGGLAARRGWLGQSDRTEGRTVFHHRRGGTMELA